MSDFRPYRQPVPPGGAPLASVPFPARGRLLSVIGWGALVIVALGCGLFTLLLITSETGFLGLVTGTLLAAIPVLPVVAVYFWLDRYEAEPPLLLVFAFAWGAGVATLGALLINTASSEAIRAAGGDATSTSILVAPFVEEGLKGLAVLLVLLLRRREFDGVVDGLVYAGMAGIGFAFVENVLYLGRTLAESGTSGVLAVFVVRCVVSPFAHPLFTAATGVGLGVAARTRHVWLRILAPICGYVVAVLLHSGWNYSASAGFSDFVAAYVAVQFPIFVGFVLLAIVARRREGRLISRHLTTYASSGWLSPDEVGMLTSLAARRGARRWARRAGGAPAGRAMRGFQAVASELAFLRERMVRGTAPGDADRQEYAMLASLSGFRERFPP